MERKAGAEKPPLSTPPRGPQRGRAAVGQLGTGARPPAPPLTGTGGGGQPQQVSLPPPSGGQACRHPSMPACPSPHTSEVLASYPLPLGLSVLLWTVPGQGNMWMASLALRVPGAGSSRLHPGSTWGSRLLNSLSTWMPRHPPPDPTKGFLCPSAAQGHLFPQPSRKFH